MVEKTINPAIPPIPVTAFGGKYVESATCKDLMDWQNKYFDSRFQTMDAKFDGLRNTIVVGLAISTSVIALAMYFLK